YSTSKAQIKIWTGDVNSDWENGANWVGGLPSSGQDVQIDSVTNYTGAKAHPVINVNSSFTPKKVDIKKGGKLFIQANLTTTDKIKVDGNNSLAYSTRIDMSSGVLSITNDKNLEAKKFGIINLTGGTVNVGKDINLDDGTMNINEGSGTSSVTVDYDTDDNAKIKIKRNGMLNIDAGTVTLINGTGGARIELDAKATTTCTPSIDVSGGILQNNGETWYKDGNGTGQGTIAVSGGRVILTGDVKDDPGKEANVQILLSGGTLIFLGNLYMEVADFFYQSGNGTAEFQNTKNWTNAGVFNSTSDTVIFKGYTTLLNATGSWQFHHVQITTGNTLDQTGPPNINVAGDWINGEGIFNENTNRVTLNGSSTQNINCTAGETFFDLYISKTGGFVDLSTLTNVFISDSIKLNSGIINTNGNRVVVLDNASSTAGNINSFIHGKLKKIGDDAFVFPTGDTLGGDSVWARIGITAPQSLTTEFEAEYFYANPHLASYDTSFKELSINNVSGVEHWVLDRAVNNDSIIVTLYWEDAARSFITDLTDLKVTRYDISSPVWRDLSQSATTGGVGSGVPGTITSNGYVTAFSPFTFASGSNLVNPLPVELLSFEATAIENRVYLKWETATETNNDHFTVERSQDAIGWEEVARIYGAGNSNELHVYTAIDEQPFAGLSYYRLKQVDVNAGYNFSDMVAVNNTHETMAPDLTVFPNPANGLENIFIKSSGFSPEEEILVILLDARGQEVYSKVLLLKEGEVTVAIDPSQHLQAGAYFVIGASYNA
ncbi:MAG: hypothetical protein ACE5DN_04495, partial [Flavobacteriales bacterium]